MNIFFCCIIREKESNEDRPEKNQTQDQNIKKPDQSTHKLITQQVIQNKNLGIQNQQNFQERNSITSWNQDCINNGFDKLQIQSSNFNNLIIFINILCYYSEDSIKYNWNQPNQYECEVKLYQTEYDENNNPKFRFNEGKFLINLKEKTFNLIKSGICFQEQSNFINQDFGEDTIQKNRIQENKNQQIKILDPETNEQLNKSNRDNYEYICQQQQNIQIWCKYNQQFSINDLNILTNKLWMTSSIIDSYVLYLNLSSDNKYFSLKQTERKNKKRILFFPSSLTTNFGDDYDIKKVRYLFESEKPQFKDINFQLSLLYHYIGFPVNKKNRHWLFLLFELSSKKVFIFDSLHRSKQDNKLINSIAQILNLNEIQINVHPHSGQQRDYYSCGYRVCSFMKYYYEKQFQENVQYKYKEDDMIGILKDVINPS
ncbi:unnamed protein product [Paramecium pentaurelia]|uniref:Ubiquitin-like protease family profile domain-containing protein n=1 Tax=Paramecium pentaurelia TaxID=43138 RepID=A0A8S1Y570_9CILI|nr:unnamed protein product [Paramecium pentaurelia]